MSSKSTEEGDQPSISAHRRATMLQEHDRACPISHSKLCCWFLLMQADADDCHTSLRTCIDMARLHMPSIVSMYMMYTPYIHTYIYIHIYIYVYIHTYIYIYMLSCMRLDT